MIGTTLVASVTLPVYARFGLGEAWLEGLPALLRLSVTNPVGLAVLLGVGLNLLLVVLPGEEGGEREETEGG